jgi:hypothetical protein
LAWAVRGCFENKVAEITFVQGTAGSVVDLPFLLAIYRWLRRFFPED